MSALPAMREQIDDRTRALLDRRRRTAKVQRRGWLVRRALLAADLVGLSTAFLIAEWFDVHHQVGADRVARTNEYLIFLLSLPGWILVAKIYGLYDRDEERTDHTTVEDMVDVFHLMTVGVWLLYGFTALTDIASPTFQKLLVFWLLGIAFVAGFRMLARAYCRRQLIYLQNAVIVGAGEVGQLIGQKLLNHPEYGVNLVGFIDENPKKLRQELKSVALLGSPDDLTDIVRILDIERVIFGFSNVAHEETLALIRELRAMDIQVDIVPRLFESLGPSLQVHTIEGLPIIGLPPSHLSRSSLLVKRGMDVIVSGIALTALFPLFIVVALAIRLDSRGPVFYRHERIGLRRRPFGLFKFRTMQLDACRGAAYGGEAAEEEFQRLISDPLKRDEFETAYKIQDDPRVTRVGRFLRRTSIDELPQLINVLSGQISIVGPRPITEDELVRYGNSVAQLLNTRPGITGYWQINGRSRLNYEDRVRLDLAYISGWSFGLDLTIIVKTFRVLLNRSGAY